MTCGHPEMRRLHVDMSKWCCSSPQSFRFASGFAEREGISPTEILRRRLKFPRAASRCPCCCMGAQRSLSNPSRTSALHCYSSPQSFRFASNFAEREGFEPSRIFRLCRFSKPVLSTTQPPLRGPTYYSKSWSLQVLAYRSLIRPSAPFLAGTH